MSDYFPADVTNEILKRLPAKSLIRFTAVCKSWRRHITGPSFVSSHLLIARTRPTHLLRRCNVDDDVERYSLLEATENGGIVATEQIHFPFKSTPRDDYPFKHTFFRIVGSCNGLICLADVVSRNALHRIIFWNPAVSHSLILPEPDINLQSDYVLVLGFGGAEDDTKLVRLVYSLKAEDSLFIFYPQAEIYSLKEGSWRRLERVPTELQIMDYTWNQALLNEVVHWIAYKLVGDDSTSFTSILTFNFASEDFGEVLLPPELSEKSPSTMHPAQVVGSLGLISFDPATGLDVWMMKVYGLSQTWTKLYRISMCDGGITRIVALWSKTKALVAVKGKELGCYDSESEQVTKLGISGTKRTFYVDDFVESLMLIKGEGVVEENDACGA